MYIMYVMSCCQYLRCSSLLQHTSSGFIKPAAQEQLHRLCCDLRQLTRLLLRVLQKATSLDNACVRGHSGNLKNLGFSLQRFTHDLLVTFLPDQNDLSYLHIQPNISVSYTNLPEQFLSFKLWIISSAKPEAALNLYEQHIY